MPLLGRTITHMVTDLKRMVMPLLGQTITHMVMDLERTVLCLNVLVPIHVRSIVMIGTRVDATRRMVSTLALSRDVLTDHAFPVVDPVSLA